MKFGVVENDLEQGTSEPDDLSAVSKGGKRKADVLDAANVDVWMSTEVVRDNYVMHWNINDIRNVKGHGAIKSPLFRAGYHCQHIWQLKVTPKEIQGHSYLGVKVILVAFANESAMDDGRQLKVSLDVSIVDKEERVCHGLQGTDYVNKGGSVGWPQFLKVNDLDSVAQENGDLRLLVGITIEMDTHIQGQGQEVTKVTEGQQPPSKKTCARDVSKGQEVNDLENSKASDTSDLIWKRGDEEPDFELIMKDDDDNERHFKVHKSVLAANSFFKKHFESRPADEQASMCLASIHPVGMDVMKVILEFLYYGELDEHLIRVNPEHFFQYGAVLEVPEIKEIAENVLTDSISAENVLDLYFSAEDYHGSKLLAKVIDFVKIHADQLSPYDRHVLEDELRLGKHHEVTDLVTFDYLDQPTDYEIVSWNVKFLVHKHILAEKSNFFKKKFEVGKLSEQKTLDARSAGRDAIKAALQFMYTGSVTLEELEKCWKYPMHVFRLAELWELEEFKNRFEESLLQDYICAENVYYCYSALGYHAPKLRARAAEYAQQHPEQFTTAVLNYSDYLRQTNFLT